MKHRPEKNRLVKTMVIIISLILMILNFACVGHKPQNDKSSSKSGRIEFSREFAPSDGMVKGAETETRKEICLNGKWDFQPVYEPYNQEKTTPYGMEATEVAPDLPVASDNGWDSVRVKVPSSWTSVEEFPSYPEKWRQAGMGWLRKKFMVPADWTGKRIILHFEAVGGDCKVLLNGEKIGGNFDSTIPFSIDITDKVKKGAENIVVLGIRSNSFFNNQGKYGKITYAPGGGRNLGIWQDVYLFALPEIYISDLFIKPEVSQNRLSAEITIHNSTKENQTLNISADIQEWINLAGKDSLSAPEVKWKLGEPVLKMASKEIVVPANQDVVVDLQAKVDNNLKYWNFETPNLYGMTVSLGNKDKMVDKKYERFGWREFRISGKNILLNGRAVQLLGDAQHLQNTISLTRRFAWSWFRLLKDCGANAARLHALVYPECYHEMADEMGIAILSESSIYASSCDLNYDSKLFWKSAKYNVQGMVKKYRNHASVYGWSIENEVLPALNVKCDDPVYKKMVYDGMGDLAAICRSSDPTRNWISGDGSRDMDGRLPVYNVHYGSVASYLEESAATSKPFCVGEASIAYYSTPRQSEMYVGDRAYRSFKDHSDGIAVDVYELLKTQRGISAYCSVWNLGYYGVEVLPTGMSDLSKAPTKKDGVFLTAEYTEGKPGVQPERIPPYSTQYNPGYDPKTPLYKPLPLYYAVKAAYMPVPQPCEWDHRSIYKNPAAPVIENPEKEVLFYGVEGSDLFFKLKSIGIPLVMKSETSKVLIVDCDSVNLDHALKTKIADEVKKGATAIFWGITPKNQVKIASLLPYQFEVFSRSASSLVSNEKDNRVASIPYKDLYFTENADSRIIMKYALKGILTDKGNILLQACPTDWTKGPNVGMMRSERENPAGPSFVEVKEGKGSYIAGTIELPVITPAHIRMISQLFRNLGVEVKQVQVKRGGLFDQTSVLTRTLIAGSYKAENFENAFNKDFIGGETTVKPAFEMNSNGLIWGVEESKTGFFNFNRLKSENAQLKSGAVYLSFWLQCPQPLNEIMADPNVPQVSFKFNVAGGIKIWLNGQEKFNSAKSVDNAIIEKLPLIKGWNHFLVKVVKSSDNWNFEGKLVSKNLELLSSMRSALNPYSERANFYTIKHTDPEIVYDQHWGLQGDGWYECSTPGSVATFKFYGTGVSLTGLVFPDGGKAKIFIDGKFDKIVDYKSKLRDPHHHYYSKGGLIDGEHEVKVEVIEGWVSIGPYEQWESFK
jgi:beta-galactosidase